MATTDTSTAALLRPAATPTPAESRRSARMAEMRRKALVWVPAGFVILLFALCFLGPYVLPIPSPVGGDVLSSRLPAGSPGHPLGTDINGNDVLSRIIYGGRTSLIIAVSVNVIGIVLGGIIGSLSAYLGGIADSIIMRILDVPIAFPSLVLVIAIAQALGPSVPNTILAMCAFSIPSIARIARSATLKVVSMPYVRAAELSGSPSWRILFRHVAPGIVPQLLNFALLGMGIIIVTEGALSFLGLGIPAPDPSWGNMIYDAQQTLSATPMLVLWPSLALLFTVLAFNILGENTRDEMSRR
ncbi:cytochrome c550 [Pseudoclavibacter endophyticus]|uniref:ABC transporter permease n=1 Tax=Pseudoclavibacter endophyticus TaxID=1778590 RepID=A0A6H9WKJ8_9MICO|nr:ABC transporter permease [Pseudoclavibacter endophyticus]KAB1649673.1 ABC transporter permease [Pseudoclavibacter endophyticus]GGA60709.1 cytochrome c550 [Pseudoclavibacter endophyticus]